MKSRRDIARLAFAGMFTLAFLTMAMTSCRKETPVGPKTDPDTTKTDTTKKDTSSTKIDSIYPKLGLYIRNGEFRKDGKPYYGIGVNYFSMFNFVLDGNTTLDATLGKIDELGENDVPFARFASPYWPKDWKDTYLTDKNAYYAVLDKLVARCEKDGVGLIPSLFWNITTIPDIFGEHMCAYADNGSETMAFIRSYTAEFVQRYKDSPAIWGWEFGNEFCNQVDIPGGYMPAIVVSEGTASSRDAVLDNMTHEMMENAFVEFGKVVRQYDSTRPIFTGNNEPRGAAWHNAKHDPNQYWVADNEDQYYSILCEFNPDPINTFEIRGYCNQPYPISNYPLSLSTPDSYFKKMMEFSKRAGKPLFNGEFAASSEWLEPGSNWTQVSDIHVALQQRIDAIVDNGVQLSAYWVYDYFPAEADCNATFNNTRYWVFNMISRANEKFKDRMDAIK